MCVKNNAESAYTQINQKRKSSMSRKKKTRYMIGKEPVIEKHFLVT